MLCYQDISMTIYFGSRFHLWLAFSWHLALCVVWPLIEENEATEPRVHKCMHQFTKHWIYFRSWQVQEKSSPLLPEMGGKHKVFLFLVLTQEASGRRKSSHFSQNTLKSVREENKLPFFSSLCFCSLWKAERGRESITYPCIPPLTQVIRQPHMEWSQHTLQFWLATEASQNLWTIKLRMQFSALKICKPSGTCIRPVDIYKHSKQANNMCYIMSDLSWK